MSSSTALLPKPKKDDHPIFLRVCHAPWLAIGQQSLTAARGLAATYMTVSFAMILDYEISRIKHGWVTVFDFSNLSYFMQTLYHVIAFTWTFMHLNYPHHSSQAQTSTSMIQKFLSPPKQNAATNNRTWFSIFYTAANAFPYTSMFIHWAVITPMQKNDIPVDHIYHHGWFTGFFFTNKYIVTGVLSLVEVMALSSIRAPEPISAHVVGIAILTWMYVAWTYFGYIFTDKYPYFFLDHKEVGWEWVITSWAMFAVANVIAYFIVFTLSTIRRELTKKGSDNKGYQQLPQ